MLSSIARPVLVAMFVLPAALGASSDGSDGGVAAGELKQLADLLWAEGEARSGRELAVTSDANSTAAATTPAPTTPVPAVQIKGSVTMTVSDPAAFAADPKVKTAIGKSIGQTIGVPESYISVTLTVVTRRLEGSARRLASGSVKADYTITLPATAPANTNVNTDAADITTKMKETPIADLTKTITAAVAAESGTTYTVEVTGISEPTAEVIATTATPSTTLLPAAVSYTKSRAAGGLLLGLLLGVRAVQ